MRLVDLERGQKMSKTHYRKVFKSDHLGSADLEDFIEEGKELIFTIKEVKQEINVSVAGKKGNHNIAYFVEPIKPLVLNATNSKVVKSFAGGSPFVEDWKGIKVELYIENNIKFGRDVVSGVRIKPSKPITRSKDAIIKIIETATTPLTLSAIRGEIQKYGLSEIATAKFNELQNG